MTSIKELESDLRRRVSGEVRLDSYSKALYSTDASIYEMVPVGVVLPYNLDDVRATIELCSKYNVPLLPRGGGTSLSGQTVNHAVVIDFTKNLRKVIEINPVEEWARVEPGITIDELNHAAQPYGLKFAPDPTTTSRATIGGAIGNNSCGSRSIVFGKTIDHVIELNLILSDGQLITAKPRTPEEVSRIEAKGDLEAAIYREGRILANKHAIEIQNRFPKILRRVSAYNLDSLSAEGMTDLSRIIVGSEGTLGVITEARVKLVPQSRKTAMAVLHFTDLIAAMEATVAILKHHPSAIELIDGMILSHARFSPAFRDKMGFVQGEPEAILLVELEGETEETLTSRLEDLRRDMQHQGLSYACTRVIDSAQQALIWGIRGAGQGMLLRQRGDLKPLPFVEDTAVAPDNLPEYVRRFRQIVSDHNTTAGYYGHASVGCLHIRPLINLKTQDGLDRMVSIANAVSDLVLEFNGSLSGEHGDGIVRGVYTEKMFGPVLYQAFRSLKHAFDPQGIMNPGKIVDCPPMTENLRYPPKYQTPDINTQFDFSADHGFGRTLELCTGIGQCRKTLTGTMCPSYMATRDEEHSTRGRANALRAALTGTLPKSELFSKRMHDVLDLCLECKACKRECPVGVDMAKVKYEFLGQYHKKNGVPIRSRLFAYISLLGRLGSLTAPVSNFGNKFAPLRWALDCFLGIDRRRPLPTFARKSFTSWFHNRVPTSSNPHTKVVLFNDTFTDFMYPHIGQAAVVLLEAAGCEVVLVDKKCCGRPMISKGLIGSAVDYAQYNVNLLYPYVQAGLKIVGTEPSCLLTLRDEYPDLVGGNKSRTVAQASYLLEEFLVELDDQGKLDIPWENTSRRLLYHGHCHAKAAIGSEPALRALRLVPGHDVQEVDSGCCGMAGAFGFEKEHYELSLAIGEGRLFPAVRQRTENTDVVVTGVSCHQQVSHATGVKPQHLAEVLAKAIAGRQNT